VWKGSSDGEGGGGEGGEEDASSELEEGSSVEGRESIEGTGEGGEALECRRCCFFEVERVEDCASWSSLGVSSLCGSREEPEMLGGAMESSLWAQEWRWRSVGRERG
jgi:hypothetical protein